MAIRSWYRPKESGFICDIVAEGESKDHDAPNDSCEKGYNAEDCGALRMTMTTKKRNHRQRKNPVRTRKTTMKRRRKKRARLHLQLQEGNKTCRTYLCHRFA